MMKVLRTGRVLVLVLLACAACTRAPARPTATPAAPAETTAAPSATAASPDPTATLSPPAPIPTGTPRPAPTVTPTPTPVPDLAERQPDDETLQAYLDALFGENAGMIAGTLQADVSGDDEADLVLVTDRQPVYILIWQDDHYRAPAVTGAWRDGLNNADGRFVYLKDYTDDGVSEVVNDSWTLRGNDEFVAVDWERQITHCSEDGCSVIWEDWIQTYGNAPISSGMFYYTSIDYVYTNNGQLILERRYNGFSVYWEYIGQDREPVLHPDLNAVPLGWDTKDKLYIDVDVIRRYVWDGAAYVFESDQVLTEPELIADNMLLETETPNGHTISIDYERDLTLLRRGETYRNDRCQLLLDGQPVGDPFICKYDFTRLSWQPVVQGLGQQLIVTTIAGDQSYIWPDLLVEQGCFHERVIVYDWDEDNLTELANIVGCVRGTNLDGVRIEDIDGDGDLEITAAPPWPQFLEQEQPNGISQDYLQVNRLVEIYEWDGARFVIDWSLEN